jgi:hypothetical protein
MKFTCVNEEPNSRTNSVYFRNKFNVNRLIHFPRHARSQYLYLLTFPLFVLCHCCQFNSSLILLFMKLVQFLELVIHIC